MVLFNAVVAPCPSFDLFSPSSARAASPSSELAVVTQDSQVHEAKHHGGLRVQEASQVFAAQRSLLGETLGNVDGGVRKGRKLWEKGLKLNSALGVHSKLNTMKSVVHTQFDNSSVILSCTWQ